MSWYATFLERKFRLTGGDSAGAGAACPCSHSLPGNTVCSTSATYQREQHGGQQDERGITQNQKPIPSRQLVARTQSDPRSNGGLKDADWDQQLGYLALQVRIMLPCPLLRR